MDIRSYVNKNKEMPLYLLLFLAFFIRIMLIDRYSDNSRLTHSFTTDEWHIIEILGTMLDTGSLNPHFFIYPSLFIYTSLFFSLPAIFIFGNSWQTLLLSARCVSLFCGLLSIFLTYKFALKICNIKIAFLSTFLLAINPLHIEMSITAKPDMMQLGLIMLSLNYCINAVENKNNSYLYGAFLFAGLAFSTKYFGILLIPVIVYTYALNIKLNSKATLFSNIKSLVFQLMVKRLPPYKILFCTGLFLFGFFLGTPYSLFSPIEFSMGIGRAFASGAAGGSILDKVASFPEILGFYVFLLFSLGLIISLYSIRNLFSDANISGSVITIWTFGFSLFLVFFTASRGNFLIPILPFALVFASYFAFVPFLNRDLYIPKPVIASILVFLILLSSLSGLVGNRIITTDENDTRYHAHDWLLDNTPENTTLMSDLYLYVPNKFDNVIWNWWGQDSYEIINNSYTFDDIVLTATWPLYIPPLELIDAHTPDYIAVSSMFYEHYTKDPLKSPERSEYYRGLFAGDLGYEEIQRFEPQSSSSVETFSINYIVDRISGNDGRIGGPEIIIFQKQNV